MTGWSNCRYVAALNIFNSNYPHQANKYKCSRRDIVLPLVQGVFIVGSAVLAILKCYIISFNLIEM